MTKLAQAADAANPTLAMSLKEARDGMNFVMNRLNDQMARIQGESCARPRAAERPGEGASEPLQAAVAPTAALGSRGGLKEKERTQ